MGQRVHDPSFSMNTSLRKVFETNILRNSSSNNQNYISEIEKNRIDGNFSRVKVRVAEKEQPLAKDFQKGLKRISYLNRHEYKKTLNRNLRDNLIIGFITEAYLIEDVQYKEGINSINGVRKKLNVLTKNFNMFLESDYKSTKEICMEAEYKRRMNQTRIESLENTVNNLQMIQQEIGMLQDRYDKCRNCERFLFSISPKPWKDSYKLKYGSIDKALDEEGDTDMYFKETLEIYMLFNELENHCFTDSMVLNELKETAENLIKYTLPIEKYYVGLIDYLEQRVHGEEETIKSYEKGRMDAETYANEMVQLSRVSLLSSQEYNVTFAHLQDYFQQCFNTSNTSLSILELFRALEAEHKRLEFEGDLLHAACFHSMTKEMHAKEKAQLLLAKKSRRDLNNFDIHVQKLVRILEPSKQISTRKPMYRSNITDKPPTPEPPPQINHLEKLVKYFFGDENDCDMTNHNLDAMYKYLLEENNNNHNVEENIEAQ